MIEREAETSSNLVLLEYDIIRTLFVLSVGFAIIFTVLMTIYIIKKGKDDKLGLTKSFKLKIFLWMVSLLGNTLYVQILKGILNLFACEQETMLVRRVDIECYSGEHWIYLSAGTVALIFYYPLATFYYPNAQFRNHELAFKFDTTFLVFVC